MPPGSGSCLNSEYYHHSSSTITTVSQQYCCCCCCCPSAECVRHQRRSVTPTTSCDYRLRRSCRVRLLPHVKATAAAAAATATTTETAMAMASRGGDRNTAAAAAAAAEAAAIRTWLGTETTLVDGAASFRFASFDTNKTSHCYRKPVSVIIRRT